MKAFVTVILCQGLHKWRRYLLQQYKQLNIGYQIAIVT